ncbi:MAG: response regulator [Oscillibacter sp.]|nr:response regulator [Oscillibacter sp.]
MIKTVIVEDDLMVASLNAQFAYKTPGVEIVATFHNGRDALTFLESNQADLLLLDLYMPDFSGLDVLRALRNRNAPTAAIMSTAANDAGHIEEALRLGIVDYLVKPFRYERFAAAVQKYLLQRELIGKGGDFTQSDIDRLMSAAASVSGENRPEAQKGIQKRTLDIILQCLTNHPGEYLTAERIAEETSLSKVTTRRYLNYLIERREAAARVNYSTGGRPSMEYCGN